MYGGGISQSRSQRLLRTSDEPGSLRAAHEAARGGTKADENGRPGGACQRTESRFEVPHLHFELRDADRISKTRPVLETHQNHIDAVAVTAKEAGRIEQ